MSTITVTKDATGKLCGATERDSVAYGRFKSRIDKLEPGEMLTISCWFPRNSALHKLHFALLSAFFEQQEQFSDLEQFRAWVSVGAGHAEFVPGPKGRMVALPKSISFRALDDADFQNYHNKVTEFLRTPYASQFLWPHLSGPEQAAMVDSILAQFERGEHG